MSLFNLGEFKLHNGKWSNWKIDCDALADKDIECIAKLISEKIGRFQVVYGVPDGGLRLQKAMEKYQSPSILHYVALVVDDVLTTGDSMELHKKEINARVIGAVIFARGKCPDWITPLWSMEAMKDVE